MWHVRQEEFLMSYPYRRKQRHGFTLVELLVVIGIIALLISILLPSLSRAREQGNSVKCINNLRQIAFACIQYANANKSYLPHTATGTVQWYDAIAWQNGRDLNESVIAPYMGKTFDPVTMICPSDDVEIRKYTGSGGYRYSYSMNKNMTWVKLNMIMNPTEKCIFYEESEHTLDDCNSSPEDNTSIDLLAIRHDPQKRFPEDENNWKTQNPNGRGNSNFADGHSAQVDRGFFHTPRCYDPKARF